MRNASPALIALLNSNQELIAADCLTIVQQSGVITRLTNFDVPVTVVSQYDNASHTFSPTFPFTRGRTKIVVGTEVDTLALTLQPDPVTNLLAGVPWPAAVRAGALDGAEILLEKVIMASVGATTPGTLILFWGQAGPISSSRSQVSIEVQSDMVRLQAQFPRNVYQPGCLHSLFDTGCTLNRASYVQTGTVVAGSTSTNVNISVVQANGYFDLGTITFTSGPNSGLSRLVKHHASNAVLLISPLPTAPLAGNTFSIVPGCDKTQSTCATKFSNAVNFRGFPSVPSPESAR
jgi:uncharacterized phage protein (TIGR02218 family)